MERRIKITDGIIGGQWVRVKKSQQSAVRHSDILFIRTPVSASVIGWEEPVAMKLSLYAQRGRLKRYRMIIQVLIVGLEIRVDGV